jgi:hypothetical protein
MTPRSPKQHSKTTTISRRLRNRAAQNLSVQPPEIPQARNIRPRRAATLPEAHHESVDLQSLDPQQPPIIWDAEQLPENTQFSRTSNLVGPFEQQPTGQFRAQSSRESYDVAQSTLSEPIPVTHPQSIHSYGNHQTSSTELLPSTEPLPSTELLPSPLPSVTERNDFKFPLAADTQQPHNPFIDPRDMR